MVIIALFRKTYGWFILHIVVSKAMINQPYVDGLYHLFIEHMGMVSSCFTNIIDP